MFVFTKVPPPFENLTPTLGLGKMFNNGQSDNVILSYALQLDLGWIDFGWMQVNRASSWIRTTAIHVIWIHPVEKCHRANSEAVNPSQGGLAFWPSGGRGVTRRDYRGIAHCWPWLAASPSSFSPIGAAGAGAGVTLVGCGAPWLGQVMDSLAVAFGRLQQSHLASVKCLGVWEGFLWPSFIFPSLLRFFLGLRCEEFKWALSEGQKVLQQGHNGQLSAPQGVSPPLLLDHCWGSWCN